MLSEGCPRAPAMMLLRAHSLPLLPACCCLLLPAAACCCACLPAVLPAAACCLLLCLCCAGRSVLSLLSVKRELRIPGIFCGLLVFLNIYSNNEGAKCNLFNY